jgi:adenosylcobinamide-GDP ribazoletransferase
MGDVLSPLTRFLVALQFLTRLPVWRVLPKIEDHAGALRQAMPFLPMAGAVIGCVTGGVLSIGLAVWPAWVAVLLALAVEALLTGALHEDGVADFCDAFGGGWHAQDIERILKDSRIGSYGMVGLLLAIGLRAGAMVSISPEFVFWAIVAAAALGRWLVLPITLILPPVPGRDGLAKGLDHRRGVADLVLGSCLTVPFLVPVFLVAPVLSAAGIGAALMFAFWLTRYVGRRLGGVTGDVLGFACFGGQLLFLLGLAARF